MIKNDKLPGSCNEDDDDDNNNNNDNNDNIKRKTSIIRSILFDYSNACILVKGTYNNSKHSCKKKILIKK